MATATGGDGEVSWIDDISTQATSLPEIIQEESSQITTVVIFVISAVMAITLLFVVAIFIDCRQEKLERMEKKQKKTRKILRLKLPIKIVKLQRDDEATLADKMQEGESSTSSNDIV